MSADNAEAPSGHIVLEYQLDAPPEKVWRAISVPGLRDVWLPDAALADPEPTVVAPGEAIRYRMREDEPPFIESAVTFRIAFNDCGGTCLRVIHELAAPSIERMTKPANSNAPSMLRAA
ncbi:SRPBCC family protein [Bosea thiooxidans]